MKLLHSFFFSFFFFDRKLLYFKAYSKTSSRNTKAQSPHFFFLDERKKKGRWQRIQYHIRGCIGLTSNMIYFGYWYIISDLPLFFIILYNIQSYISNNSIYHFGNFLYFLVELEH